MLNQQSDDAVTLFFFFWKWTTLHVELLKWPRCPDLGQCCRGADWKPPWPYVGVYVPCVYVSVWREERGLCMQCDCIKRCCMCMSTLLFMCRAMCACLCVTVSVISSASGHIKSLFYQESSHLWLSCSSPSGHWRHDSDKGQQLVFKFSDFIKRWPMFI